MNKMADCLSQILNGVTGKDVRRAIHDAIALCYAEICREKEKTSATEVKMETILRETSQQIEIATTTMETKLNTVMTACNGAMTRVNEAMMTSKRTDQNGGVEEAKTGGEMKRDDQ